MAEAVVNLPCGCFFKGRELVADPDCEEHGENDAPEEWSCDRCGESAQDGSGICITCGAVDEELTPCDCCGREFPIDLLDGKPTINSHLRRVRAREGQLSMLYRAAVHGYDFDRLECRSCYGPGFQIITDIL